ncbi:hypothetical protein EVAR_59663_1 [Eumeta japonica]|uniref:Uncharacterized protein n=1 Tax=Eumeta variegata TaxID=151549 RepID=A0A4C1Z3U4_EUMVA|nr:hypothetical protein EVAR_59663_1 [Eumeta japonica]
MLIGSFNLCFKWVNRAKAARASAARDVQNYVITRHGRRGGRGRRLTDLAENEAVEGSASKTSGCWSLRCYREYGTTPGIGILFLEKHAVRKSTMAPVGADLIGGAWGSSIDGGLLRPTSINLPECFSRLSKSLIKPQSVLTSSQICHAEMTR